MVDILGTPKAEEPQGTTTKRGAQKRTPHKEASARAQAAKEVFPRVLSNNGFGAAGQVETSRADMNVATIAALRTMMWELNSSLRDSEATG